MKTLLIIAAALTCASCVATINTDGSKSATVDGTALAKVIKAYSNK